MSRQVKSVIYYDGQIFNTDVRFVFVRAQFVELTFNRTNQLRELELEAVIDSHCSSGNAKMELYVEFVEVDEAGQFSTNVVANEDIRRFQTLISTSKAIISRGMSVTRTLTPGHDIQSIRSISTSVV
ncbi:hypothetical protein PVK06_002725 [Gossypium arboreum]|uniref:Uncharacterized protein n=1 Tax=Gossypium arboreum TaxID=29729 RepID=A0ABR0R5G2_GOSAR|nr:hypothetical protein PVK06_002725 [Gossypium arboreum]